MSTTRFDIHQTITDQIIAAIEAGAGEFKLPWHRAGADLLHPRNVASKIAYRGVNILTLWLTAEGKGYSSGLWGTYNQWASLGAEIRKGEKAAYIVFYKQVETDSDDTEDKKTRLIARATPVFAAEQVTGYDINTPTPMATSEVKHFKEAEAFIQKTTSSTMKAVRALAWSGPVVARTGANKLPNDLFPARISGRGIYR